MHTIAALFGGQGCQYPGMGKSLYRESAKAREVYECASDILGFDVASVSFDGTAEELTHTAICQPALFTHCLAAWTTAESQLPTISAVAGHSLGEYAALCCAGAFSMEDGFRLIGARAKVMENAARSASGTMVAIGGSDCESIQNICQKHGDVWAVNFNYPGQTVISGATGACLAAAEELASMGFRTARLKVGSAFHTPMMQTAADQLLNLIGGIRWNYELSCDFYSNLTGTLLHIENYAEYFAKHMVSPVRFVEEVTALGSAGIDTCIEFGAGKTASTLAKKNNRALAAMNIECAQTLQKTVDTISSTFHSVAS